MTVFSSSPLPPFTTEVWCGLYVYALFLPASDEMSTDDDDAAAAVVGDDAVKLLAVAAGLFTPLLL